MTALSCVNGLTPTGDGNEGVVGESEQPSCVNGLTPTGDGNPDWSQEMYDNIKEMC